MPSTMTFSAAGDSFITRCLPSKESQGFRSLASFLQQAECRFTNLETVIRRDEGFAFAVSGGTWASSPPQVLEELKAYGFNAMNWATNHTMDYGYQGLAATQRYLDDAGITHFGAGENLAQASAPRFMDCPGGRVAWLGATFAFNETWRAGSSRPESIGRPGINPLRTSKTYTLTRDEMNQLQQIAAKTGINLLMDKHTRQGFYAPPPEGTFRFGSHLFQLGQKHEEVVTIHKLDHERMLKAIRLAVRQADAVIVSLHCHDMHGDDNDQPPKYLVDFARACIDAGAHAIVGHGPHVIRGVEIYKHRPIFYSLGNFIFQSESVQSLPADFYEKYDIDPTANVADALDIRSKNGTVGLGVDPKVWESVVAQWSMRDGKLVSLELRPITLGFGQPRFTRGWPSFPDPETAAQILKRMTALSAPFGTQFTLNQSHASLRCP